MSPKLNKVVILVLLAIFLLPLLFLNVSGFHGWGGDFSQYIHQAINIAEGKPVADLGFIINEDHPFLAPSAYPVGFPILLSPVYAIYGNEMIAFMFFMAILLILLGGVNFLFLSTVNGQRSTVNGQRSTVNGQRSTVNGQRSTVNHSYSWKFPWHFDLGI